MGGSQNDNGEIGDAPMVSCGGILVVGGWTQSDPNRLCVCVLSQTNLGRFLRGGRMSSWLTSPMTKSTMLAQLCGERSDVSVSWQLSRSNGGT